MLHTAHFTLFKYFAVNLVKCRREWEFRLKLLKQFILSITGVNFHTGKLGWTSDEMAFPLMTAGRGRSVKSFDWLDDELLCWSIRSIDWRVILFQSNFASKVYIHLFYFTMLCFTVYVFPFFPVNYILLSAQWKLWWVRAQCTVCIVQMRSKILWPTISASNQSTFFVWPAALW